MTKNGVYGRITLKGTKTSGFANLHFWDSYMTEQQLTKCIKSEDVKMKPCPDQSFSCELNSGKGYDCNKANQTISLTGVVEPIESETLLDYKSFSGRERLIIPRREIHKIS